MKNRETFEIMSDLCREFSLLTLKWTSLIAIRSYDRREGDCVKGMYWGVVILASYEFHFIRVHENLV